MAPSHRRHHHPGLGYPLGAACSGRTAVGEGPPDGCSPGLQPAVALLQQPTLRARPAGTGVYRGADHHYCMAMCRGAGRSGRQFAVELVQLQVDIIVSDFRAATLAAKTATSTIPIVFVGGGDPVPEFVPNLAQPGGNVTGVGNLAGWEFFAKHLELLMEAVPGVTRVALLLVARDPFNAERTQPMEMAARARGIQLHRVEVEGPHDFERAFAAMTQEGIDALLVSFTPLLGLHSAQLGALAAQHRLPAIFASRAFVVQGGLMSYHWANLWPRVASYVDRILKGDQTREPAGGAAHQIRVGPQPQDSPSARDHVPSVAPRLGG
jgi:hypothetical protein